MAKTMLKTVARTDGLQRAVFEADANGTYRYVVDQFYPADPGNPYEEPPGHWSQLWQSGIYASLEEAERSLTGEGWPVVTFSEDGLRVITTGESGA